jgi:hypothetical protein
LVDLISLDWLPKAAFDEHLQEDSARLTGLVDHEGLAQAASLLPRQQQKQKEIVFAKKNITNLVLYSEELSHSMKSYSY